MMSKVVCGVNKFATLLASTEAADWNLNVEGPLRSPVSTNLPKKFWSQVLQTILQLTE
jgi:hypothetical protein